MGSYYCPAWVIWHPCDKREQVVLPEESFLHGVLVSYGCCNYKSGGLKQQNFILTFLVARSLKSDLRAKIESRPPFRGSTGESVLASSSFWWPLAFLGLAVSLQLSRPAFSNLSLLQPTSPFPLCMSNLYLTLSYKDA